MTISPKRFARPHPAAFSLALLAAGFFCGSAFGQGAAPPVPAAPAPVVPITAAAPGWQACHAMSGNPAGQLKCFQEWASAQAGAGPSLAAGASAGASGQPAATQVVVLPSTSNEAPDGKPTGCRNDKYSSLSRFWELQRGTDCGSFSLRGYRATTLALVASDGVNSQPTSSAPGRSALTAQPYQDGEVKLQVSLRTKLFKGLLKSSDDPDADLDSLWFGYTQQSYWQLFNRKLSRPFRNTDHEPELIYIYPHQIPLPGGWSYRLTGLGISHQSNGQALPLSRSWNRAYVMGAAEKSLGVDSGLTVQAKLWDRIRESSATDDNPDIENYIGRAEFTGTWQVNKAHTLGLTVRHSLRDQARGSTQLEWMLTPKKNADYTGLRYHVQLFSGYGDSLVDYNRKRNVLSLGVSLVDW